MKKLKLSPISLIVFGVILSLGLAFIIDNSLPLKVIYPKELFKEQEFTATYKSGQIYELLDKSDSRFKAVFNARYLCKLKRFPELKFGDREKMITIDSDKLALTIYGDNNIIMRKKVWKDTAVFYKCTKIQ